VAVIEDDPGIDLHAAFLAIEGRHAVAFWPDGPLQQSHDLVDGLQDGRLSRPVWPHHQIEIVRHAFVVYERQGRQAPKGPHVGEVQTN
jgi:hypothetical protein